MNYDEDLSEILEDIGDLFYMIANPSSVLGGQSSTANNANSILTDGIKSAVSVKEILLLFGVYH